MHCLKFVALALAVVCFVATGCSDSKPEATEQTGTSGTSGDDHGHSHEDDGHAHADDATADAHGPNGGHPIKFEDAEFGAEWLHYSDNDIIRVIFLDKAGKTNNALKIDSLSIKRASGDDEVFTLDAENAGENGEAASYMIDNKDLVIAMTLGVVVEVKMGDKVYSAKIDAHKSHDH